jgi:O-antigen/teichoic acid export membrane protein
MQQQRHFGTAHLQRDLRVRSVRGGVATLATQAVGFVVKLVSLAALARLVTKEDFGLVFAITAITTAIGTVKEFGLAAATQQRAELDHAQVTALFWVNVGLSLVAALATAAAAPAIVWFYHGDPRLVSIVLAYAGMGLFDGLAVQHQALLKRQMRFRALAVIEIASLVTSRGAAIGLAFAGGGCWALVLQALVLRVVAVVGVWLACAWRPGRPAWTSGIRPLLRFGRDLTGVRLLGQVAVNADKMLLARFAGEAATGLYGNAYRLLQLGSHNIVWPLTTVALPVLSRLQDQPERFRAYFVRAMALVTAAGMPTVVFMFLAADRIVLTVLGPQWAEAALIFRILAPTAFLYTLNPGTGWVYTALGRTDRQVRWNVVTSGTRVLAIAAGIPWGAIGVATAVSVVVCALRLPGIIYCFRETPLRVRDLWEAIRLPAVTSLAAGAALVAAGPEFVTSVPPWGHLLAELAVYAIAYGLAWLVIPGGRAELRRVAELVAALRPDRRTPGSAGGTTRDTMGVGEAA